MLNLKKLFTKILQTLSTLLSWKTSATTELNNLNTWKNSATQDITDLSTWKESADEDLTEVQSLISPGTGAGAVVLKSSNGNTANGNNAVAVGSNNAASADYSFVSGYNNISYMVPGQSVRGRGNDYSNVLTYGYLDIVGNGTPDNRSNAYALTKDGDAHYALNTAATSGTVDGDLYAAVTALGWGSEVTV